MGIVLYIGILIVVSVIAYTCQYFREENVCVKVDFSNKKLFCIKTVYQTPFLNILLVSLILAVYSFWIGIRPSLPDRIVYGEIITESSHGFGSFFENLSNLSTEVASQALYTLLGSTFDNPNWLFFISTFALFLSTYYVLSKMTKSYAYGVMFTLVSMYYLYNLYLVKQSLSSVFINLALLAFLNKRKKLYFLFILIATCFHMAAVIFFPIYFLLKIKKNIKNYALLYSFVLFFAFILFYFIKLISIFFPFLYGFFSNSGDVELAQTAGYIIILQGLPYHFIFLVALLKRKKIMQKYKNADFYIFCSFMASAMWIFAFSHVWFFRFSIFFTVPIIALVPMIAGSFRYRILRHGFPIGVNLILFPLTLFFARIYL